MADNEIRGNLENGSYPLFVFRRYAEATGKSDRSALEYILERWALSDPQATAYGVSVEHFTQAKALENVTQIGQKRLEK